MSLSRNCCSDDMTTIKHPEVLRVAGHLLDREDRRTTQTLAVDSALRPCASASPNAYAWSIEGAVLFVAIKLKRSCIDSLADLEQVFQTSNVGAHWDRALVRPRWTQDEMVEKLKAV